MFGDLIFKFICVCPGGSGHPSSAIRERIPVQAHGVGECARTAVKIQHQKTFRPVAEILAAIGRKSRLAATVHAVDFKSTGVKILNPFVFHPIGCEQALMKTVVEPSWHDYPPVAPVAVARGRDVFVQQRIRQNRVALVTTSPSPPSPEAFTTEYIRFTGLQSSSSSLT